MGKKTKKQHYIPRLLLKNFSKNKKDVYRVEVYDSQRNKTYNNVSITNTFSQNYFYDKDNIVEKYLCNSIETPASLVIERILDNPYTPYDPKPIDILRFISVQLSRTPKALTDTLKWIDKSTSALIEQALKLNNYDPETPPKFVIKNPRNILVKRVLDAALDCPLIQDLEWHVFINKSHRPFILSDHPVVHYNWFLKNSNDKRYTSITSCGLQIFMPLSPEVTYCLYDKNVYKIGSKNENYSLLSSSCDIDILNQLQVLNRDSIIVYRDIESQEYVQELCSNFSASSLFEIYSAYSDAVPIGDNKLKSIQGVWRTQVKLSKWLSPVKVINNNKKQDIFYYDRCPKLIKKHELFMEKLTEMEKQNNIHK